MNPDSKVFVAGAQGLVGSAIVRNLEAKHYNNIFWVRRNILRIKRFFENKMMGWPKLDANLILYFEIVLPINLGSCINIELVFNPIL